MQLVNVFSTRLGVIEVACNTFWWRTRVRWVLLESGETAKICVEVSWKFPVEAVMPTCRILTDFLACVFAVFFFLRFLLLLPQQPFLQADGFRLARIDGKMTNKQRQVELRRFGGKGDDCNADVREGGADIGH